jgi:hypothetical protein
VPRPFELLGFLLLLIDPTMRVDFSHDLGRSDAVRVAKLADDCRIEGPRPRRAKR